MEAFLVSTGIVALAEIGDKTQLLAFILAARLRRPAPIILGILVATVANHALAGAAGAWLATLVGPEALRCILGISFIAMAVWTLVPDTFDEADAKMAGSSVFGTTFVAFFLAEMGDKTRRGDASPLRSFFRFSFGPLKPDSFDADIAILKEALAG